MALKFPDILKHKNILYAIMDALDIRGGHHSVNTLADRNSISIDKRKRRMLVSYFDGVIEVTKKFTGLTVSDVDWTNNSNWKDIGSGFILGETEFTAYRGDRGKSAYDHSQTTHAPSNAEENVQSDWNQVTNTADDYIKNKPDLTLKADLVNGLVPANQLPSYVDDVLEYANLAAFPAQGESSKIYTALDTNLTYRWGGTVYVKISDFDLSGTIHAAINKETPIDADEFGFWDSVTGLLRKLSWTNIKATLKSYFDLFYYQTYNFACSDETTIITAGTAKFKDHWPFNFVATDVFVGLSTASSSGNVIIDVNDDSGNSIFSTRPTILVNEETSLTNPTQPAFITTSFTKGDKITVDFDSEGTGAKGVKIHFKGIKS